MSREEKSIEIVIENDLAAGGCEHQCTRRHGAYFEVMGDLGRAEGDQFAEDGDDLERGADVLQERIQLDAVIRAGFQKDSSGKDDNRRRSSNA